MSDSLDSKLFAWLCEFTHRESAIVLGPGKEYLVTSRLAPLARLHNFTGVNELLQALMAKPVGLLRQDVIEALTTNETSFFRDIHPFVTLRTLIIPEILTRRTQGPVYIWCGAASTGQEPYTIAMVLSEYFPELASRVRILCTDINHRVLARTAEGIYSQHEIDRGLPPELRGRYFEPHPEGWQAKASLRAMLDTKLMNLAVTWPALPVMDLVFLRNVLIYFDIPTRRSIVARIRERLATDGFLVIGGSESLLNIDDNYTRVHHEKTTIYRRTL